MNNTRRNGQHRPRFGQHNGQHPLCKVVSMASAPGGRRGFRVVEALDREWCELVGDHRGTVVRWADRHDALASCQLDDVLSAARLNSDPVLAALLAEVSIGDQVAGA